MQVFLYGEKVIGKIGQVRYGYNVAKVTTWMEQTSVVFIIWIVWDS